MLYEYRLDHCARFTLAGYGGVSSGAVAVGPAAGGAVVINLEALYGLSGLLAVLLMAYLVYALICAEDF